MKLQQQNVKLQYVKWESPQEFVKQNPLYQLYEAVVRNLPGSSLIESQKAALAASCIAAELQASINQEYVIAAGKAFQKGKKTKGRDRFRDLFYLKAELAIFEEIIECPKCLSSDNVCSTHADIVKNTLIKHAKHEIRKLSEEK